MGLDQGLLSPLDCSMANCMSLPVRGTWHVQLLVRCATHWAFRIHTLPFFTSPQFACEHCVGILRVAFASLPPHVAFAFCRLRVHACALRSHVCSCVMRVACRVCLFSFARSADVPHSHVAFALRTCALRLCSMSACRSFRRVQFYSAARKSHTTQTSTRSSFFTSKEKSCAQRVLTRGSRFRIVDEGKES